jgi:hypothetical protein
MRNSQSSRLAALRLFAVLPTSPAPFPCSAPPPLRKFVLRSPRCRAARPARSAKPSSPNSTAAELPRSQVSALPQSVVRSCLGAALPRGHTRAVLLTQPLSDASHAVRSALWPSRSAPGVRPQLQAQPSARPNPSLERTATGKPLGPRARQCHHRSRGPSAFPASAAQLKR